MKKSVLLTLVIAPLCLLAGAHAQTTNKFEVNGIEASMTACLNNCDGVALVTVASGQSQGAATWFVYFDVYGHDSQGNLTHIGSSGQIPTSMVSGDGKSGLTLNLDTNAAGLNLQYCVADQSLNWTCSPYSGGIIDVTWTRTQSYTQKGTLVDQTTTGPFKIQYHLSGTSYTAVVQANVFGQQYTDAGNSQLSSDHVGQISYTQP